MDQLSIGNEIFLGGYAEGQLPTTEVQDLNFEGCIEEFYFGPDPINLSVDSPGAYGVQPGCTEGEINLVTFPAANPGYMQLQSFDIQDQIEISFMFRTSQSRALLLYMHDTPGMGFSFNFFSSLLKTFQLDEYKGLKRNFVTLENDVLRV